jgi:hypothetical protein
MSWEGSKLHLAGDAGGLPLAVILSAANANDATMFEAVLDDIPPDRSVAGRLEEAADPLPALLRTLLRPGDAGLLGHLLPRPPAAAKVRSG